MYFLTAFLTFLSLIPSFLHIGTDDGLSQVSVLSITEDEYGAIWVGTSDGLNKINGQKISIYRQIFQNDESIIDDEIFFLASDADGGILACSRQGISIYNRSTDNFKSIKTANNVSCCADLRKLRNSTPNDPKWLLFSQKDRILAVDPTTEITDTLLTGIKASCMNICDSLLYIGTNDGKIYRQKDQRNGSNALEIELLLDTGISNWISDIKYDRYGTLWASFSSSGIISYNTVSGQKRIYTTAEGLSSNSVRALEIDDDDIIWAATANNLTLINPLLGKCDILRNDRSKPESISSTSLKAIYKSKDGTLWLGSFYGGLDYYDKNAFQTHTFTLPENNELHTEAVIRSLNADSDGSIWIGTNRSGIFRYFPEYGTCETFNQLPAGENVLNAVAFHNNGSEVILACTSTGLSIFNKRLNKITWQQKMKMIFCICNYDDTIYLVGALHGLYIFDIDKKEIVKVNVPEEKDKRVFYSFSDSQKNIWIGYNDRLLRGQLRKDANNEYCIQVTASYPDILQVQDIKELDKSLYFASRTGLLKYNLESNAWSHLNSKDGTLSNLTRGIEVDSFGNIWVATDNSILLVNHNNFEFQEYTAKDGISNTKYNSYCHCKTNDGTIWFGGIPNICYFKPTDILKKKPECPVIVSVQVDGKKINDTAQIPTLRAHKNSIVYNIAIPGITSKAKIYYRLEGYDTEWNILPKGITAIPYNNIPSGEYTLDIKSVNIAGLETLTSCKPLKVTKPWHEQWWFILLVIVVFTSPPIYIFIYQQKKSEIAISAVKDDATKDIQKAKVASYMTIQSINREKDFIFMQKALQVVNENFANENFGIDEFANAMNMSRSNLHLRMKDVYGAPAVTFIKRIRIEKAIEYLNKGEMSISEIAYSTGFSSATYFATVFKQISGISPTNWKQKYQ